MSEYITADNLRWQQASDQAPVVVDVRSPEEYAAGHLPGALQLPADHLWERLGDVPADRPLVPH